MCINAVRRPTPRRVFSHHGELFLRVAAKVDGLAVHYELLKTAEAKSGQRNREKAKGRGTMCAKVRTTVLERRRAAADHVRYLVGVVARRRNLALAKHVGKAQGHKREPHLVNRGVMPT